MREYKLRTGHSAVKEINKTTFEQDTKKKAPWYQFNDSKKEGNKDRRSQYAVCPECDNPIQIIGLYHNLKNTDRPYGRHTGKPLQGFAYFNAEGFETCPYVRNRRLQNQAV